MYSSLLIPIGGGKNYRSPLCYYGVLVLKGKGTGETTGAWDLSTLCPGMMDAVAVKGFLLNRKRHYGIILDKVQVRDNHKMTWSQTWKVPVV